MSSTMRPQQDAARAEQLKTAILQSIVERTGRQIRDLRVEVVAEGVVLSGRCHSFYCKQLAQQAALPWTDGTRLKNEIEVAESI